MSNMSYCRFQNTLGDLQDCYDALCEEGELSEDERRAKEHLIQLCSEVHHDFGGEGGRRTRPGRGSEAAA